MGRGFCRAGVYLTEFETRSGVRVAAELSAVERQSGVGRVQEGGPGRRDAILLLWCVSTPPDLQTLPVCERLGAELRL